MSEMKIKTKEENAAIEKPKEISKAVKPTRPKAKKSEEPVDAGAHVMEGADVKSDEPITEFNAKINKYGFLHVPKKALSSLPFRIEEPLQASIDSERLVITVAAKKL
jgi:hypothetical protein